MSNLTKSVDGVAVELTDEEQAQLEADAKAWNDAAPAKAMAALRRERNDKLSASDWRGISDNTMSDEWKSYRSQLRDLPANVDLNNIVWPEEPE